MAVQQHLISLGLPYSWEGRKGIECGTSRLTMLASYNGFPTIPLFLHVTYTFKWYSGHRSIPRNAEFRNGKSRSSVIRHIGEKNGSEQWPHQPWRRRTRFLWGHVKEVPLRSQGTADVSQAQASGIMSQEEGTLCAMTMDGTEYSMHKIKRHYDQRVDGKKNLCWKMSLVVSAGSNNKVLQVW